MTNHLSKQLISFDELSCEEIVLQKNRTLHFKNTSQHNMSLYCISGIAIIHALDSTLSLIDTTPMVSGEVYVLTENTQTFLIESLNTTDHDLKFLKILTRTSNA